MANFAFTKAMTLILNKGLDFGGDDFRALLVMTNTTADVEGSTGIDAEFLGDITLDEMDGANYARVALSGEEVNEDVANNRAEFDDDDTDTTFSTVGVGTRQVQAAIVYLHVTNDADSKPVLYIDTGGFPFTANGSDIKAQWNTEGIMQLKNA